jgi:hypothetical protein
MKLVNTNYEGFRKNEETGVVINNNIDEYKRILEKRQHRKELNAVQGEVYGLKDEIQELKQLLSKVLKEK